MILGSTSIGDCAVRSRKASCEESVGIDGTGESTEAGAGDCAGDWNGDGVAAVAAADVDGDGTGECNEDAEVSDASGLGSSSISGGGADGETLNESADATPEALEVARAPTLR